MVASHTPTPRDSTSKHRPRGAPAPLSLPSLLLVKQQGQQTAGERHQQQAQDGPDRLASLRQPLVLLRVLACSVTIEAHPERKPRRLVACHGSDSHSGSQPGTWRTGLDDVLNETEAGLEKRGRRRLGCADGSYGGAQGACWVLARPPPLPPRLRGTEAPGRPTTLFFPGAQLSSLGRTVIAAGKASVPCASSLDTVSVPTGAEGTCTGRRTQAARPGGGALDLLDRHPMAKTQSAQTAESSPRGGKSSACL